MRWLGENLYNLWKHEICRRYEKNCLWPWNKQRIYDIIYYNCVYCEDNIVPTEDELLKLEDAHYRKIDLSDGIYVVNMDGYIGTSVKKIEYAERHGKEVLYHYNQ